MSHFLRIMSDQLVRYIGDPSFAAREIQRAPGKGPWDEDGGGNEDIK
jgi:hypothetical protein